MMSGMEPDADRFVRAQAICLASGDKDLRTVYGPGFDRAATELPMIDVNDAWCRIVGALLTVAEDAMEKPASQILSDTLVAVEQLLGPQT